MADVALLIDFGSTYTKAVSIDIDQEEILAIAHAPSTVETNIMEGLRQAVDELG